MKCLNLIGQCEVSKSLRATVHGIYTYSHVESIPKARSYICNNNVVYGYIIKSVNKNPVLLIQNINN